MMPNEPDSQPAFRWGADDHGVQSVRGYEDDLETIPLAPPNVSGAPYPPGAPGTGGSPQPPGTGIRFTPFVVGVIVAMLVAGLTGFAVTSFIRNNDPLTRTATDGPRATVPVTDPAVEALRGLGVQQEDVATDHAVTLIPQGDTLNAPTLDLCNGNFPSEGLRSARVQVAEVDGTGAFVLSTEAVLYRSAAATRQAFFELRDVAQNCPSRPVADPSGGMPATTFFNDPPDTTWPAPPASVERQAYSFESIDLAGNRFESTAVYIRRGRVLLGVYFTNLDQPRSPVAGETTIPGIVSVMEERMAALPQHIVGG
jgi:hypothetical protein